MPNMTTRNKVAALPNDLRRELIQAAYDGESITSMAERFNIDYRVIQRLLWESGTLPWQGAKTIISRRLRSIKSATKRADREQLADDVAEQVDYLYFAARQLQAKLDKMKSLAEVP